MRPFRDLPIARKPSPSASCRLSSRSRRHRCVAGDDVTSLPGAISMSTSSRRPPSSPTTLAPVSRSATSVWSTKSSARSDVRPNIDMVCVYDESGRIFSQFQRAEVRSVPPRGPRHTTGVPVAITAGDGRQRSCRHRVYPRQLFGLVQLDAAAVGCRASRARVRLSCRRAAYTHLQQYLSKPILDLASTLDQRRDERRLLYARSCHHRRRSRTPGRVVQYHARGHPEERHRARRAAPEIAGKQPHQGRISCDRLARAQDAAQMRCLDGCRSSARPIWIPPRSKRPWRASSATRNHKRASSKISSSSPGSLPASCSFNTKPVDLRSSWKPRWTSSGQPRRRRV